MATKAQTDARAHNPYVPDPNCKHLSEGWAWMLDSYGDRVMGRCECWKRWKGQQATTALHDHKAAAAGGA